MCAHPELNQYIRNVLLTVRSLLLKNSVKKVVVEISDEHHKPIERFNFEIQSQQLNIEELLGKDKYLLHLEESMRAVCLKIGVCDAILKTRPPLNSSFKVLIFTTTDAAAALEHQHQAEVRFNRFWNSQRGPVGWRGARLTFWQQVKMALLARRSFCVVTGGSRGLGREISLRLSQGWSTAGVAADLVVLSRDRDAMLETKRMIEKSAPGVAVHVIQADLGEIKSLDEINAKVWSLHDASRHEQAILVLNAGTIGNLSQPISQQTCPEAIQNHMAVNFTSNWSLCANFLSKIKSGPRLIIHITSLLGRVPMAGFAAYGSAKAACSLFVQILAAENPDVRVLNYSPGPLDTDMFHKIIREVHSETVRKNFQDTRDQKLLSCETSVRKLIGILEEDKFENATTVDYYDE